PILPCTHRFSAVPANLRQTSSRKHNVGLLTIQSSTCALLTVSSRCELSLQTTQQAVAEPEATVTALTAFARSQRLSGMSYPAVEGNDQTPLESQACCKPTSPSAGPANHVFLACLAVQCAVEYKSF